MIPVVLLAVGVLFASILPTGIYIYAERRSRRNWLDAKIGRKRAPLLVHVASWTGLMLGQLAIPFLFVAGECAFILFGLAKVGRAGGMISFAILALALSVIAQVLASLRLFPASIRLLANDANIAARTKSAASTLTLANLFAIASSGLAYAVVLAGGSGHPIDRVARAWLYYGVVVPVVIFAAAGLVQAALVARAGRAARG
jgi:hypothetical protein